MEKLKLYLDVDLTIADSVAAIVSLYNEDFQHYSDFREIKPEDIQTYGFEECKCTTKDYINHYFNQQRFFDRLDFIDDYTYKAISELTEYYDITIVSHGYSPNLRAKEKWIKAKLPMCNFIGVNLKQCRDKSCVDMSGGVFIDDGATNLLTSNADFKICFGKEYPWNKDWDGVRVDDWWKLYVKLVNYAERKADEVDE